MRDEATQRRSAPGAPRPRPSASEKGEILATASRGFGLLKYCPISPVLPPSRGGGGVRSPSGREVSRHADCRARCSDRRCLHHLRCLVGLVGYSRDCFQRAFEKALQLADANPRGRSRQRVRGPGPTRAVSSNASVSAPTGSGVAGFLRPQALRSQRRPEASLATSPTPAARPLRGPASPTRSRRHGRSCLEE